MSTPHAAFRHFPLNAWYAAAWDHEVGRNLLAKTIAGRPIVFYRTTEGRPVALGLIVSCAGMNVARPSAS